MDLSIHWERKIMRLCAVGMVSGGTLDENEKEAIKKIIKRDLKKRNESWSEEKVTDEAEKKLDTISKRLEVHEGENPQQVEDAQRGLFVDVKSISDREALEELRDIVYVIKADDVVAEVERIAFVAIAKILKFTHIDSIWDKFFDMSKEKLLDKPVKMHMYHGRRTYIDVYDVGVIENAIVKYKVDGPLKYGLQSAIQRDKYDLLKHREKNHKRISKIALLVFACSAIILYFECAHLLEYKIIANEMSVNGPGDEVHVDQPTVDLLHDLGVDYVEQQEITAVSDQDSLNIVCQDSDTDQKYRKHKSDSLWLAKHHEIKAKGNDEELDNYYVAAGIRESWKDGDTKFVFWILLSFMAMFILPLVKVCQKWLKYRYGGFKVPKVLVGILVPGSMLLLYWNISEPNLSIMYTPFCVLLMMLSIEVMTFMRERYTEKVKDKKKESSKLLIIFVAAAIIADLCIGLIELPANVDNAILIRKIAYSVFLGCVSFFAGKFMEMYSIQKQVDMETMETSMKNINDYISEN